jgi:hypothetical protein
MPGFIAGLLAPVIARIAASQLESALNTSITSMANSGLASFGLRLTPTAVICARKAAVLPALGLSLQLMFSDLFGGAVVPLGKHFEVAVTPKPQDGVQQAYKVRVTDAATHAAVSAANVTLHNFHNGNAVTDGPHKADLDGSVPFNVTLASQLVPWRGQGAPPEDNTGRFANRVHAYPTLTVEKTDFNPQTVALLP